MYTIENTNCYNIGWSISLIEDFTKVSVWVKKKHNIIERVKS